MQTFDSINNEGIGVEKEPPRYCRFRKFGIKYIDYKEYDFLLQFVNPQGKILPRRITAVGPHT